MGKSGGDSCRAVPTRVHVSPREGDEDQQRNEEMRREAMRTEGRGGERERVRKREKERERALCWEINNTT